MKLKRESFTQCVADVAAQAAVSQDAAFGIIQRVADQGEKLRRQGVDNPFKAASEQLAEQAKIDAVAQRIDTLKNAVVRNRTLAKIEAEGGIKTAATTLSGILRFDPKAKTNTSIESRYHALEHSWFSNVMSQLKVMGLDKVAISGSLDKEISEAIWRLNSGEPSSVTLSPEAQKIGKLYHDTLELTRQRLNNAGARIGEGIGHITETQWDPRQLNLAAGKGATREAAFQAWREREEPRIDPKTFDSVEPAEKETPEEAKTRFLKSLYDATSSGVHKTYKGLQDDGSGYVSPAYEGTHNIGRGLSKKRVVYWKSSADWFDHMQEFGGGEPLINQINSSIRTSARNVALMEGLGTNPEGNFNTIIRRLQERYRDDPEIENFNKSVKGSFINPGLKLQLDYLTGVANIPKNQAWSDIINTALLVESESKLGGVAVPHFLSAPMTLSSELDKHGFSRANGIGRVLKSITTMRSPEERQAVFNQAGAFSHGFRLGLNTITPNSGIPGYLSWTANNFMRLTGLPKLLDRFQAEGVKAGLMNNLADNAGKAFEELDPKLGAILKRYEIGPEEWNLLRKTTDGHVTDTAGIKYLTAKTPDFIPDEDIKGLLTSRGVIKEDTDPKWIDKKIQQFRWNLSDRYLMYLNDAAERSTVTPGVKEQATLLRGTQPGSIEWAIARGFSQFKAWPLAALNQILGREFAWSTSRTNLAANIGWVLGLSTIAGALRMSVVDTANGRPVKNFLNPQTAMTALAQGGGLGLFGDYLFGEVNRGRNSSLAELFGPLGEDTEAFYKSFQQFKADLQSKDTAGDSVSTAFKSLASSTVRGVTTHIPYSNLIYLKGALDYLAFYHIYEALSPGWWERTNKRMEKETGHFMSGYVPGKGVPYGIPPVLSTGQ